MESLFASLGLSGLFSSRAFLPAFMTSVMLRWGDQVPLLNKLDFIQATGSEPNWFTNSITITVLGVLAVLELVSEKSPEVRQMLDEGMVYVKTGLSMATSYGFLSATDAKAVQDVISHAGFFDAIPAVLSGAVTYFAATTRQGIFDILNEGDEDDSLGIRKFLSWCEELWASFGVLIIFVFPLLMLLALGAVFGSLFLIRKRHEAKQEKAKIACPSCQTRIHPFATGCFKCGTPVAAPKKLGFFGGTLEEAETNVEEQKLRLIESKRSPLSGEKAEGRGVDVACAVDGVKPLGDPGLTRRYLERVQSRLLKVLLFGGLFSLVPGIGLIIGVVYYRLQLVGPFRRYLPLSRNFLTKWLIRLVFFVLITFQWVPVAGGLVVPIMALLNYWFYSSAFKKELERAGMLQA